MARIKIGKLQQQKTRVLSGIMMATLSSVAIAGADAMPEQAAEKAKSAVMEESEGAKAKAKEQVEQSQEPKKDLESPDEVKPRGTRG